MNRTANKFSFENTVWIEIESGGGLTGRAKRKIRTGIRSVDSTCLSCGHEWHAGSAGTGLVGMVGGAAIVTCPICSEEETISQLNAFDCP